MLNMKRIVPYYILCLILFSSAECKKNNTPVVADNPYGLPNATQNGSDIFACRVNGQNRIAKTTSGSQGGYITKDSVSVGGAFGKASFENIALLVYGKVNLNTPYRLDDTVKTKFFYDSDSSCFGITADVVKVFKASGTVTFSRIDSVKRIISGTFLFNVPIPNCDTLYFTDGRFDINF
jgi:hypothetical protein